MLVFILILYVIVAILGVYLLTKFLTNKPHKTVIGVIHGILGLLGISFLIIYTSFLTEDTPYISILLFVLAFFFGGGMFVMSIQGKKFPKAIAFVHIAIALTGIFFLIKFWMEL